MRSYRSLFVLLPAALLGLLAASALAGAAEKQVTRYARFRVGNKTVYGVVEGESVREIKGSLFGKWQKTDTVHRLDAVKLLAPTQPTKVLATAGNYRSHLGDTNIPEKFRIPQIFYKPPSCIVGTGANIVLPPGTNDVHYEAEMVVVIGKRALDYVLGVTCGNDVSARDWQKNDVQWWRAKGSDTFGPCGPFIAAGLNYDDLPVRLRVNGEVKQNERTSAMIHNVPALVSFLSHYVTLNPGDLIYTGTSGKTTALHPGDVVEVEIEGVGVLRNKVVGPKKAAAAKE